MHSRGIIGAAALLSLTASVTAQGVIGFNYGNKKEGDQIRTEEDYVTEFNNAKNLPGADGMFTSARLYTMLQGGTEDKPNEAIAAAIKTNTSLLLGTWCSAGSEAFDKEIAALTNTIEEFGDKLTPLVVGLSVGSEDLYRNSEVGIKNKSPVGANPEDIIKYIKQVRDVIKGTVLEKVPLGHVDTADVWVNGSNAAVVEAVDWLGVDAYPYFEGERENSIENAPDLFFQGFNKTEKISGGKPIWITETGWPISGKDNRLAIPGAENAREFYVQVGCRVFGRINTWYYILEEDGATPNFGVSAKGTAKPFYDLSCSNVEINYSAGSAGGNSTSSNSTDSDSTGSSTSGGSSSSRTSSGSEPSGSKTSGASYTKSFGISAMMLAAAGVAAFLV